MAKDEHVVGVNEEANDSATSTGEFWLGDKGFSDDADVLEEVHLDFLPKEAKLYFCGSYYLLLQ